MKTPKKLMRNPRLLLPVAAIAVLAAAYTSHAVPYPDVVLEDNPIAYYRFEDPVGSFTVTDSSASGAYPGTVFPDDTLTWPKFEQPGIGSNSISFYPGGAGTKPYISVPYNPDLNPSGPFTLEAWARPTSLGTGEDWRSPVGCFSGWGVTPYAGWFFYQSPGATPSWIWVEKGGGIWVGGVAVKRNQWDHLVASFDGTTVTFYVNGVNSGSANAADAPPNAINPFCIGQRGDGATFFDGNVDEVAIYTNALSAERIQLHYEVGLTNFYSGPIPAYISQDPASATSYAGRSVTFTVGADGTSPLTYQWYKGSSQIAGATTDTYTFLCDYADNNATYTVAVSNQYGGVVSAAATLTVMTDLTLASSPASINRYVGSKAAFRAEAGGALPITYKWYKGASPIAGATDATLWLPGVQLSDNNTTYYCEVSNQWNVTNTEPATLTVMDRPVTVPITSYAKVVMNDDPVAYWRLDEPEFSFTAVDAAGSFDGTYDANGAGAFSPGIFTFGATTGIPYETNKAVVVTNGARITVPYALELNPHGPFAAEAWIKPDSLSFNGEDYRTVFSSEDTASAGGPYGWLLYQQPNNRFAWVLFAGNWISAFVGAPTPIIANNWYHIVLQYDGSIFYIFVNGQQVASTPYDIFIPNKNAAVNLGWRSDNDWKPFAGTIDDVAFYNKALSPDQIKAHYQATVRLTYTRSGDDLILSWPFGTLQQSDQAPSGFSDIGGATSPYTNAIGVQPKYFRVRVQ